MGVKRRWGDWGGGRKLTCDGEKLQERLAGCCARCKEELWVTDMEGRQEMKYNLVFWGPEKLRWAWEWSPPSVSSKKEKKGSREVLGPARALAGGSLPGLKCRWPPLPGLRQSWKQQEEALVETRLCPGSCTQGHYHDNAHHSPVRDTDFSPWWCNRGAKR